METCNLQFNLFYMALSNMVLALFCNTSLTLVDLKKAGLRAVLCSDRLACYMTSQTVIFVCTLPSV